MPTMAIAGATDRHRGFLRSQADTKFVERDTFFELLVSRRRLIRVEDSKADVSKLIDADTGQQFLIELEKLSSTGID